MPDFNTSQEDYEGTVQVLKRLGLKELILSREFFHFTGLFMERRVLFEVARFKKLLEENGISTILYRDSFDARQSHMVEHLYRQLSKPPKGEKA